MVISKVEAKEKFFAFSDIYFKSSFPEMVHCSFQH
jgi:hypothetical protein